ncbi:MAG: carbohydrate ABC transporter permease [Spirochaetales bacterium]|nr:carbohydrate ABC transporter permease [Spirochaetales bacterium]
MVSNKNAAVTTLQNILKWIFLGFFLFISLYPLLWLFLASFKGTNLDLQTNPFGLPEIWHFENYADAMATAKLGSLFFHSILVAGFAVVVNLAVTSMGAFILSRVEFRGREVIYTMVTAGVLIPIISFMVPYFTVIRVLGLYDRLLALIIVYSAINIPVSIFLLTNFMGGIPQELEEAAIIDGCRFHQRFTKVILPLTQSGLATAGTLCFIYAWNEFIMALLLTSSESSRTIQLGIRFFTSQFQTDYTSMYAAIVLSIIPSVIIYTLFNEKIVSSMTAGAVKG